jgi:hypothetical protein
MVCGAIPVAVTVMVAVLALVNTFAAAVTAMAAFPDPEVLLAVNQVWLLETVQLVFELMLNEVVLLAVAATERALVDKLNTGLAVF